MRSEDQIVDAQVLDDELRKMQGEGSSAIDKQFANDLAKSDEQSAINVKEKRVSLSSESGRILRASLFEVLESLKRAYWSEELKIHMMFIARSGVAGCTENGNITPVPVRDWDGFDALRVQNLYIEDWDTKPREQEILAALAADGPQTNCVRSLRCYRDSFFEMRGSFAMQFGSEEQDEVTIVRADNYTPTPFKVLNSWFNQDTIDEAICAFVQFSRRRFREEFPASRETCSLIWIAVGSNSFGWGDIKRASDGWGKLGESDLLQSAWILISVPKKDLDARHSLLSRFATTIPEIDGALTQSLILESHRKQGMIMARLKADMKEMDALKDKVRQVAEVHMQLNQRIKALSAATQESTSALRALANDLSDTWQAGHGFRYDAMFDSAIKIAADHNIEYFEADARYAHDLRLRLENELGESAAKRFLTGGFDFLKARSLKEYVCRAFSDTHAKSHEHFLFGSLRAALLWRCVPEPGLEDDHLLFSTRTRLIEDESTHLIEDGRKMISVLVALVHAWLGPGNEERYWIRAKRKDHCSYRFSGGWLERAVDPEKLSRLAEELMLCSLAHRPMTGGDLTQALWQLTRVSPLAPPLIKYGNDKEFGHSILVKWPGFSDRAIVPSTVRIGCTTSKYLDFFVPAMADV